MHICIYEYTPVTFTSSRPPLHAQTQNPFLNPTHIYTRTHSNHYPCFPHIFFPHTHTQTNTYTHTHAHTHIHTHARKPHTRTQPSLSRISSPQLLLPLVLCLPARPRSILQLLHLYIHTYSHTHKCMCVFA